MCTVSPKRKDSLSDDKRWYVDAYNSLAYGHPDIPVSAEEEMVAETRHHTLMLIMMILMDLCKYD